METTIMFGDETVVEKYKQFELKQAEENQKEADRKAAFVVFSPHCTEAEIPDLGKYPTISQMLDCIPKEATGDKRTVIGLLGGMGPIAGSDMLEVLVKAFKTNPNVTIVLYSNPDGQIFADGAGFDDLDEILEYNAAIEDFNTFFASNIFDYTVSCSNTYHIQIYWNDETVVTKDLMLMALRMVTEKVAGAQENFISMIHASKEFLEKNYPEKKIGLMATNNTVKYKTYNNLIGDSLIYDEKVQDRIQAGIQAMKAGDDETARKEMMSAVDSYVNDHDVTVLMLGCTEIPLIVTQEAIDAQYPGQGIVAVSSTDCVVSKLKEYATANAVE